MELPTQKRTAKIAQLSKVHLMTMRQRMSLFHGGQISMNLLQWMSLFLLRHHSKAFQVFLKINSKKTRHENFIQKVR